MQLSSITYAYPHVDNDHRAELVRRHRQAAQADAFVLSTCLRMEVAVAGDEDRLRETLAALFGDPAGLPAGKMRSGSDAILHLFRVAAGLESPVTGEREVLTQFREAASRIEGTGVSGLLVKVVDSAVAAGRQARTLLPASPHDSLASVAAQVVGQVDRVAVFGSGLMAEAVVDALRALEQPPELVIVARRPERIDVDGVQALGFANAVDVVESVPGLVSATSAKHHLLAHDELATALQRRTEPLLLVDMAMPPDFPRLDHPEVQYSSIDDLAAMAGEPVGATEADEFVEAAASEIHRQISHHHEVGPVIADLMAVGDEIVDEIASRFAGRLSDETDRETLRQAIHTAARTLLARPVAYLHGEERLDEALEVITAAFDLENE